MREIVLFMEDSWAERALLGSAPSKCNTSKWVILIHLNPILIKKATRFFARDDPNLKLCCLVYLNHQKNDLPFIISRLRPFWPLDCRNIIRPLLYLYVPRVYGTKTILFAL